VDSRTVKNWFDVLWKFEFLVQPECGVYNLNLSKIGELELSVKVPPQIDSKQRRLL
jgi:hypothetical protein